MTTYELRWLFFESEVEEVFEHEMVALDRIHRGFTFQRPERFPKSVEMSDSDLHFLRVAVDVLKTYGYDTPAMYVQGVITEQKAD